MTIGTELTRLHANPACVPQPTCARWANLEQHQLVGTASASSEWSGSQFHIFSIAEQDAIVGSARATAIAQTPPGKRFYRLTFDSSIFVDNSPIPPGFIFATAYYGRCLIDTVSRHNRPR